MSSIVRFSVTLIVVLLVAACASPEVLAPRNAAVPAGVDFSGQWQLSETSLESKRRLDDVNLKDPVDIVKEEKRARTGRSSRASKNNKSVHIFIEAGSSLKITQTEYGIFISFDRSVVEEYRFGENRRVNVGPIVAARVSGWEGSSYVIETLDDDGVKLVERYRLEDENLTLVRHVSLWEKEEKTLDLEQVYNRN
jgi:hypothetical protein